MLFYIFFQWKILLVVIALTLLLVLLGVGGGVIALLLGWNIEESGHLFKHFCSLLSYEVVARLELKEPDVGLFQFFPVFGFAKL